MYGFLRLNVYIGLAVLIISECSIRGDWVLTKKNQACMPVRVDWFVVDSDVGRQEMVPLPMKVTFEFC